MSKHFLHKTDASGGIHWLEFETTSAEQTTVTSSYCHASGPPILHPVEEARKIWKGFKSLGYAQTTSKPVR